MRVVFSINKLAVKICEKMWDYKWEDVFRVDDVKIEDFMKKMLDDIRLGYKNWFIDFMDREVMEWLIINKFVEKIDDEYINHYMFYPWQQITY